MHKFTPVGPQNSVAKTLATEICSQLSNIPHIFRHCDLLDLNKINEKKYQLGINLLQIVTLKALSCKLITCDYFLFVKKVCK